ncbi:unnamed protein product [Cylindrotheca closterium]|uniref:RING-type E3 ubiquitin transferase n=1 Tax=Cylindrotheca closterium TaxID=2856 RepID=A0AAD2JI46_9STRA|nr:unnamed protein product [Cylindrotheca closterium]
MYLRSLQDSNSTETIPMGEEGEVLITGDDWSFEFTFVSTLVAVIVVILCIREYYVRRYGVDFCPVFHLFRSHQAQVDRDRVYAEEVQRQLDSENQEADLEARRKERREWYEAYLVPYTMTVEESDFFYAQGTDENGNTILKENLTAINRKFSSSSLDIQELGDEAMVGQSNMEGKSSDSEDNEEENEEVCLRLPIKDGEGNCRSVEANCTICFSAYQIGDKVVWSDLRCNHAFHYDCILPWLVKGKKRCPICRAWFVPGSKIEDQRKALAERLAGESTMSSTTDGPDETNSLEVDPQGSSDAETLPLKDEADANAGSSILQNPECQQQSATQFTNSKNQRSFEKQLSSFEGDDETTSCDCQWQLDIPTNSGSISCMVESKNESETVPSNGEYPAGGTDESLIESSSASALDLERQTDCGVDHNNTDLGSPDLTATTASSDEEKDDQQEMDASIDDQSLSALSETQEMSA